MLDDSTNSPLENITVEYFHFTAYQNNFLQVVTGHLEQAAFIKKHVSKITDIRGEVIIDKYCAYYKLFEYKNYEIIVINIGINDKYLWISEEEFSTYSSVLFYIWTGEFKEYFNLKIPNHSGYILVSGYDPIDIVSKLVKVEKFHRNTENKFIVKI